jgi:hypothetical protein
MNNISKCIICDSLLEDGGRFLYCEKCNKSWDKKPNPDENDELLPVNT